MPDNQQNPEQGSTPEQQFVIQKVYTKDISFETPNSPGVFTEKWEPNINLELSTAGHKLADEVHEVVLSLTVTAKVGEKTAYLVETQQAGVFNIRGLNEHELSHALGSYCPNILFPFAREVVADLVNKGGFPQLLLAPVNLEVGDLLGPHPGVQEQQQQPPAQQGESSDPVH